MPHGGLVTIAVTQSRGPGELEFSVTDTGLGVPPELQRRIFEPFFTTKDAEHGTGLGLAVCRTIIESHGGRLAVDSAPGHGACFRATLPITLNGIS
jgi:signal transduction histidine kinase